MPAKPPSRFLVRYLNVELRLPIGAFTVGRSSECELPMDTPLVSRRHAMLWTTEDSVMLEDLGSRNGVLVNDAPVGGRIRLEHGDRLAIGGRQIVFLDESKRRREDQTTASGTDNAETVVGAHADAKVASATEITVAFARESIARGDVERAEKSIGALLDRLIATALRGLASEPMVVDGAVDICLDLAERTRSAGWVERVVKLYSALVRFPPAGVVERFEQLAPLMAKIDAGSFRAYMGRIRAMSLSDEEKELLERLRRLAPRAPL